MMDRKYRFMVILISLTLLSFQLTAAYPIGNKEVKTGVWKGNEIDYIAGQILLKPKTGVLTKEIIRFLTNEGYTLVEEFDKLNIGMVEVPETTDLFERIDLLNENPLIEWAEPNGVYYAHVQFPNDQFFNWQWGLNNTGQTPPGGTPDADIDAPEGWGISRMAV